MTPSAIRPLPRTHAWALALTATLTMAVSYMDRQTMAALGPTITRALGISDTELGWLLSAFSIAYLVATPFAGWLIDVVGARRGLLGAVLAWSIVAALHALVPGFGVLFALRIALGITESPSFPGAAQTVHRALPPTERARGLGILFTGSSFGAMVAPKLASWLNDVWDFRAAFLGSAAVGLLWVPLWLGLAYQKRSKEALDPIAAPAPSAGRTLGASDRQRRPSPQTPGRPVPSPTLTLLKNKAVWRAVALIFGAAPLLGFFFNWLSKLLDHRYGVTQKEIGNLLILPPLLFDIGAVIFGSLATRRLKKRPDDDSAPTALVVAALVVASLGAAVQLASSPWVAMTIAGVAMGGGGGLYALATADVLRRVPSGAVSTAGGITAASQSVALILVNPMIGWSVDRWHSYAPAMIALVLWMWPATLVWIFIAAPPAYREPTEADVPSPATDAAPPAAAPDGDPK